MLSIARHVTIPLQRISSQTMTYQSRGFAKDQTKILPALNYPKLKQVAHNSLASIIPGFDKIEPKASSSIPVPK